MMDAPAMAWPVDGCTGANKSSPISTAKENAFWELEMKICFVPNGTTSE